ncbi:MAG TPA: hypothetical protein VGB45_07380 [Abditibacterium sp.]
MSEVSSLTENERSVLLTGALEDTVTLDSGDIHTAFARFLDVANGDADTNDGYYRGVATWVKCASQRMSP